MLRECEYTAPSGSTFELQFEDLERSGGKKAAVHEHPQQNGATVQDLGNSAERFPLSVFFTGDSAQADADDFFEALSEKGIADLRHPRWGDLRVLPISWTQAENLVGGVGRVDFSIEFIRAREQSGFPLTAVSWAESIASLLEDAATAADRFAENLFDPETASDLALIIDAAVDAIDSFGDAMTEIVADSYELAASLSKAVRDFEYRIDTLIGAPFSLFQAVTAIARIPSEAPGRLASKLDAYAGQIAREGATVPTSKSAAVASVQRLTAFYAGVIAGSLTGTISSRQEAVALSESLAAMTTTVQAGAELAEATIPEYRPPVEVLAALAEAAALARESLLERAYSLPSERRMTLATERTPLDLVFDLYGDIDRVDEFIEANNLQGEAIIMIPAGTEVVYYE